MLTQASLLALIAFAVAAIASPGPWWWPFPPFGHGRSVHQQVAFACYGGGGNCACPTDLTGDSHGVLINVYPGYQCAYTGGACTWHDTTGALQNTAQTNCPASAPCSTTSGCQCPIDNNGDTGVLINQFTGYQCAYVHGACTWDYNGTLQNAAQTNCPTIAKCAQLAGDS
ncbi:hypothetical protein DAEQUDRAFT_710749 [Daedalea quercina L-15889]|uniref:Uncharacterized protein n=1 Tax=Daedalea quercina L-15889 TaxID=1314783 RepID=A0A165Q9N7_9APHY|nr:hypothetical protein DAEQUDRAFT_710749 [Daedalea quercina L-15889]